MSTVYPCSKRFTITPPAGSKHITDRTPHSPVRRFTIFILDTQCYQTARYPFTPGWSEAIGVNFLAQGKSYIDSGQIQIRDPRSQVRTNTTATNTTDPPRIQCYLAFSVYHVKRVKHKINHTKCK